MKNLDFSYYIKEGFKSIFVHGFMSFAAISAITACLVLMGSFVLLAINVDVVLLDVESKNVILAYVNENSTPSDAAAVEHMIRQVENVNGEQLRYIDRDQAFADYKDTLGEYGELLDGLEQQHKLRPRFSVPINDINMTVETAAWLEQIPGVEKVSAGEDVSNQIINLRSVITLVCVILIIVLGVISILITSNTVKLATFDRRDEIAIMRMVGATNAFIRWPFVFEGLLLGLFSSLFAFFLQWFIYDRVADYIRHTMVDMSLVSFSSLGFVIFMVFLITGLFVGILGSLFSIRRYLKV